MIEETQLGHQIKSWLILILSRPWTTHTNLCTYLILLKAVTLATLSIQAWFQTQISIITRTISSLRLWIHPLINNRCRQETAARVQLIKQCILILMETLNWTSRQPRIIITILFQVWMVVLWTNTESSSSLTQPPIKDIRAKPEASAGTMKLWFRQSTNCLIMQVATLQVNEDKCKPEACSTTHKAKQVQIKTKC